MPISEDDRRLDAAARMRAIVAEGSQVWLFVLLKCTIMHSPFLFYFDSLNDGFLFVCHFTKMGRPFFFILLKLAFRP